MPLFSQPVKPVEPPPPSHWGEAKGRVRHIRILPSLLYAVYVIEEAPAWIDIKMKMGATNWTHKVFAPWRYYFIRVRYDGRVDGGNTGYLLYALSRLPDLTTTGLCDPLFPNVFDGGGICLGYTSTSFDKTPVRSAWRAIRLLYSIPGNQWLNYSPPSEILRTRVKEPGKHTTHLYSSGAYDNTCHWSDCTEEKVMSASWKSVYSSIDGILTGKNWEYQRRNEWDNDTLQKQLDKHGVTL